MSQAWVRHGSGMGQAWVRHGSGRVYQRSHLAILEHPKGWDISAESRALAHQVLRYRFHPKHALVRLTFHHKGLECSRECSSACAFLSFLGKKWMASARLAHSPQQHNIAQYCIARVVMFLACMDWPAGGHPDSGKHAGQAPTEPWSVVHSRVLFQRRVPEVRPFRRVRTGLQLKFSCAAHAHEHARSHTNTSL